MLGPKRSTELSSGPNAPGFSGIPDSSGFPGGPKSQLHPSPQHHRARSDASDRDQTPYRNDRSTPVVPKALSTFRCHGPQWCECSTTEGSRAANHSLSGNHRSHRCSEPKTRYV
ncbi:MAG: hypothetical protein DWH99_03735 [Planctomycetota bacterium]|nr:MAG: hypothetical protein DWH99_03735 [Planctomycetota bacterium]